MSDATKHAFDAFFFFLNRWRNVFSHVNVEISVRWSKERKERKERDSVVFALEISITRRNLDSNNNFTKSWWAVLTTGWKKIKGNRNCIIPQNVNFSGRKTCATTVKILNSTFLSSGWEIGGRHNGRLGELIRIHIGSCSCTRYNARETYFPLVSLIVFTPLPEQIRFNCRGSPFISIRNEVASFSLALGIGWCRHEAGRKADRASANKPAFQSVPAISPLHSSRNKRPLFSRIVFVSRFYVHPITCCPLKIFSPSPEEKSFEEEEESKKSVSREINLGITREIAGDINWKKRWWFDRRDGFLDERFERREMEFYRCVGNQGKGNL